MTEELPEESHDINGDLFSTWRDARQRRDAAQSEMDSLRDLIVDAMPDGIRIAAVAGTPVLRVNRVQSSRLDTARLRSDYPDIAAMYSKPSESTRLELIK